MLIRRFYDDKLAQASYMIGCQANGQAIVIDPHRDSDMYLDAAREEGLEITHVSETHIHADYLSGSRQLAKRAGATLLLSGDGDESWQYGFADADGARLVHDGDVVKLGNIGLKVLHTPGHTPEHICFEITDGAASTEPMGIITGDFIFVGDVGRPDLLEKAAGVADTMEAGARVLYRALERFRDMPAYLQILPGHGAGSACGKALGSVASSTLGYERLVNWAFQCETEADFVSEVLQDQPEPPFYFAEMKRMNRDGPAVLDRLPRPKRMEPGALAELLGDGGIVVDTRDRARFAAGHVAGTINVPLDNGFPNWCGWLLPYDRPVYFIVESAAQANQAARDLAFIGIDNSAGYFDGAALDAWPAAHGALETTTVIDWPAADKAVDEESAHLIDVRKLTEWNEGHAPGAAHVHLGYLRGRLDELPRDRPLLLYCRTGHRSGIGVSILQAEGFSDVRNVDGGITDRTRRGLATV
ncbi:MAG: MBL fold metallo-hydrolase [Gemmatimonadetes bacterium]|jgi:hydroxyacylglutathione hydrolase|nr:MBL fold metallo-hydrolase [Gemmatimonadota bacterium]